METKCSKKFNHEDKNNSRPLSEVQERILRIIKKHIFTHNVAPTFREIGEKADIQFINTVKWHLGVLERRGHIKITKGATRCISIINQNKRINRHIPFNAIIESQKIEMNINEDEEHLFTVKYFQIPKGSFIIHIMDNSMFTNYEIRKGDSLILHPDHDFQNGETALLVDENNTVYLAKYIQNSDSNSPEFRILNSSDSETSIRNALMLGFVVTMVRFQI